MKRDMDLIREILLYVEEQGEPDVPQLEIPGRSEREIGYHLRLARDAGLIEADLLDHVSGTDAFIHGLTWAGHDFLDAARDTARWRSATKTVAAKAGGLVFEVLRALLIEQAKREVGLGS